jgi:bcr-type benzoyl-CoA reductase subunit C
MEDKTIEELTARFNEVSQNKYNISDWAGPSTNNKIFGYFCTYFPVEIVHAAGMLPFRILGDRKRLLYVDAHLPSFGCSFVRTALELALDGTLNYIAGIGFSHTCDSIQVLSGVWSQVLNNHFVTNIIFPAKLDEPESLRFLVKELHLFMNNLEKYFGVSIKEEKLWESIDIYDKKRLLLEQLYQWRRDHPGGIKGSEILNVVNSGMLMDPEEHNTLLEKLLLHLNEKDVPEYEAEGFAKVVLSGNICAFPDIINLIEDSGALVVDDNLCTGSRCFSKFGNTLKSGDKDYALSHVARTYLNKSSCPAKYNAQVKQDETLLSIVEKSNADGVIFLLLRLCEPYSYEYTFLKKALDNRGYPSLVIEYEQQTEFFDQIQTRVEAFVENIKN